MASNFYDKHLPDYGDLDNKTGTCPGFRLGVRENDGGVGIDFGPVQDDPDSDSYYGGFMTPAEAEDFCRGIQKAIDRANSKNGGEPHPSRVKDPSK